MKVFGKTAVSMVQVNMPEVNALGELLMKRSREFKLIAERINSMSQNKLITSKLQRHTIGILTALVVVNPLFWIFGIKGVAMLFPVVEFISTIVKYACKVCSKTIMGAAVILVVIALSIRDLIKTVIEMPWIFILLWAIVLSAIGQII